MILANDIKKGDFIKINEKIYKVTEINKTKPGKGPAYVNAEMFCVKTLKNHPMRFGVDEKVEKIFVESKIVNFSYDDRDTWFFYDENGEEYIIKKDLKDKNQLFFPYCETITLNFDQQNNEFLYYECPAHCNIIIIETSSPTNVSPNSGRSSKPATLENGVTIHIPNYLSSGQKIKLDLRTMEYIGKIT